MTYQLFIGDRSYSSWSLRGWLCFARFGIDVTLHHVDFNAGSVAAQLSGAPPARTVPTVVADDGTTIWDSMAIAEELADRHPDAGLWPTDPDDRATARALACEMHSGFAALREECPMNLRFAYRDVDLSAETKADIARIEALWAFARDRATRDGPWLFGAYSVADAFFAPVAARLAGYGVALLPSSEAYVRAHLEDLPFRQWRAMGLARGATLPWYDKPHVRTDWPGPSPLAAHAVDAGPSINETCPYSGKPVTHFLALNGRTYGFCNAFCRDKTAADPAAWPAFMALVESADTL